MTELVKQNYIQLGAESNQANQAIVAIEASKAVQEVQASLIIAKRFPRDEIAAQQKINNACLRPGLAEAAIYTYSRGGTEISGPSIRLAEAIAQYWGNIDFGWREVERRGIESTVQAYAWDKETNTRREMSFTVKHVRNTKKGSYPLTDERDIYENNANNASRRMRACILSLVPGDIVDEAVLTCEKTLETKIDLTPERMNNMVKGFEGYGVTRAQIEKRIQRNLDAIAPAQFAALGKIYNSIRDGISKPSDWFEAEEKAEAKPEEKKTETNSVDAFKKKQAAQPEQKTLLTEETTNG